MKKPSKKKTQNRSKDAPRKPAVSKKKTGIKAAAKKLPAKHAKPAKPVRIESAPPETIKPNSRNAVEEPQRLLRETKSTTAALHLLEKSIKLIYHKDFRKARAELKILLESYPDEQEILARARTYAQICEREETAHKKPVIANDHLYNLGVIEHNRGDYDKAILYFRQYLEKNPNSDHIYYSLAASFAIKGETAEAVKNLQKAVELNDENRVYAKNDSDFLPLHGQKEFIDLVGWCQPATGG